MSSKTRLLAGVGSLLAVSLGGFMIGCPTLAVRLLVGRPSGAIGVLSRGGTAFKLNCKG
jgi:hypothetical protein